MSGRRGTKPVQKKGPEASTIFLIGFIVLLGGVIVYEFFRRRRLDALHRENQKKHDQEVASAEAYLKKNNYKPHLNDPTLTG